VRLIGRFGIAVGAGKPSARADLLSAKRAKKQTAHLLSQMGGFIRRQASWGHYA
jgi:hypothetical protein